MSPRPPGRPPLFETAATVRLEFRVTPRQRADLDLVAAECRQPLSSILRDAVDAYCGDYRDTVVFRVRPPAPADPPPDK